MAQRDTYNFNITASNQQAKDKFDELKKLAEEVNQASSNLGQSPGSNENISSLIKSMSDVGKEYNELKRIMSDEIIIKARMEKSGSSSAGQMRRELEKEMKQVEQEMQKVRNKGFRGFSQSENASGTRTAGRVSTNPSMYAEEDTSTRKSLKEIQDRNRQIKADSRKAYGLGRSAIDSRYINHSSASSYRSITNDLLGPNMQGADINTVLSGQKFTPQQGSYRAQAQDAKETARARNREIMGNLEQLHGRKDDMGADEFQLQLNRLTEELKDTESVVASANKGLEELDRVAKQFADQNAEIQGTDIREKADRDTIKGRMSERAFSVGLATVGAALYTVASQISKGTQTVDNLRNSSMSVGMRTNDYDFRSIRQSSMDMGNPLGYQGADMLGFSESVLGSLGYVDQNNLNDNAMNLAEFSKFSGADQDTSTAYTESLLNTGGITTADQARAIQDGVLGAIKASGMEGREKEQIEALTAINESVTRGREVTEDEIRSRSAMSAVLSGTGNRAFQGNNLANTMGGLDDMVRNADPFSTIGMLMGIGSDEELSNERWNYNRLEMQQGGITPELFNRITGGMGDVLSDDPYQVAGELVSQGLDVDVRALRELLEEYPDGLPVGEDAEKLLARLEKDGSQTMTDREEGYMDSPDQARESQQAYQAQLESLLNDNKWMDMVTEVKKTFSEFGSQNAGAAGLTSVGGGVMTGVTTMMGSMVGGLVSQSFMKMISGKFAGTAIGDMAGKFAGGAGPEAGGLFGKMAGGAKDLAGKGVETVANTGLGGTILGGLKSSGLALANGASKLPMIGAGVSAVTGVYQVAKADDKVKETGKQVGATAGAWGGAKAGGIAGAALGSIVPVVGTAAGGLIGGALGGIGGWLGGGALGEWVGDKASGLFGKKSKEPEVDVKGTYQVNEEAMEANEGSATANEKALAETLRADNVAKETENLSRMEAILAETRKLLTIAASQGGILGSAGGVSGGSGKGGTIGNGEYWTNTDLTQHDLGASPTGLTAEELDEWINAKAPEGSVMRGMGSTFLKAGQESGLDPRYLVSHAAHETAWGTSNIAKKKGNMYGIGAFDASPYKSAYGYDNTEAGIIGGAKWISENYYDKGQTTLDSMLNGDKKYATDPGWADKIAGTMKGAEAYTGASVTVQATVNYTGTGDPEADGRAIGKGMGSTISTQFTQEQRRIAT